ncbi:hypothetical protein SDRG_13683 [Saprolegnia diclina VS20]|uniref:Uncharacterized protein n=1 Tax=Saprolegnia diclina (strain VS20) TaxID=1156394 RepID=T0PSX5_SAPDV|nr:hypothetical protein SDRG_13683 [Saprolegnia diclina VS20]EQC28604.1 hypothetical protein SDRG_13683 [Saprolegnia diclina VS20]|eukprot:XP_008618001.1 hypothetical protein SDRG_13683 [Saprolegnia diclina VS20]
MADGSRYRQHRTQELDEATDDAPSMDEGSVSDIRSDDDPPTIARLADELQRSRTGTEGDPFGDSGDDIDKAIAKHRSELHEIKARKHRARGNPVFLSMEDFDAPTPSLSSSLGSSAYITPTKTSLAEIAQRVASSEQRLRSDRMRLTDLSSNDGLRHSRGLRSPRRLSRSQTSPTRSQLLLSQKAIHKWHPDAKRTQVPNDSTPLDMMLSSSDYDRRAGSSADDEAIAVADRAHQRLRALTKEFVTDDLQSPVSDGSPPQPRMFTDLQRKMDDMNKHLERLQEEKRQLERNQLDAERQAVDMSSSLRILSAQVSQFLHNGEASMQSQDLHTQSQYQEDLLDELKVQRQLLGDLETEMARWRHDAEMLEQGRVLEQDEQRSQLIQFETTGKLLEEKADAQAEHMRQMRDDVKALQKKLELVWERLHALEAASSATEAALHLLDKETLPSWLVPSVLFLLLLVCAWAGRYVLRDEMFWLWLCAVLGYDCIVG